MRIKEEIYGHNHHPAMTFMIMAAEQSNSTNIRHKSVHISICISLCEIYNKSGSSLAITVIVLVVNDPECKFHAHLLDYILIEASHVVVEIFMRITFYQQRA